MAKILIADDAAFIRKKTSSILIGDGHEVVEAATGLEAIDQYKKCNPDAVLLDITMPELDGLAALREIRALNPSAKIAMVTAMGQQSIVMEALKAGASDFVIKPFETQRLIDTVNKLIA